MPKRKHRFEVLIEARLVVDAFDEASARRKVERALSTGRPVSDDVAGTGEVWIYDVIAGLSPVVRRVPSANRGGNGAHRASTPAAPRSA